MNYYDADPCYFRVHPDDVRDELIEDLDTEELIDELAGRLDLKPSLVRLLKNRMEALQ